MRNLTTFLNQKNPWLKNPRRVLRDSDILTYRKSPIQRNYEQFSHWVFESKARNLVIRGPKYVGKTTFLKLLTERIISENEYTPIYCPLRKVEDFEKLPEALRKISTNRDVVFLFDDADQLMRYPDIIDELSSISIKNIYTIWFAELPNDKDMDEKAMLPLSFKEFVLAQRKNLEEIFRNQKDFMELFRENSLKIEAFNGLIKDLQELFRQYIITGGLPGVIAEYIKKQVIRDEVYYEFLLEFKRLAKDCLGILRVFLESIRKFTSMPLRLKSLRKKSHLEKERFDLCYSQLRRGLIIANMGTKLKKTYFRDPFYYHIANFDIEKKTYFDSIVKDLIGAPKGYITESIVFEHLFRREKYQLNYLRKGPGEIDFILNLKEDQRIGFEVKYKHIVGKRAISKLNNISKLEDLPVVILSYEKLSLEKEVKMIPVYLFLMFLD
ncbi:MAG: hypothetical protein DRP55_02085 [Spirochaetes bacterium]|nr:MAG: hypothetical protein DRP55_02085 [Spirochaetota bacterium]